MKQLQPEAIKLLSRGECTFSVAMSDRLDTLKCSIFLLFNIFHPQHDISKLLCGGFKSQRIANKLSFYNPYYTSLRDIQ